MSNPVKKNEQGAGRSSVDPKTGKSQVFKDGYRGREHTADSKPPNTGTAAQQPAASSAKPSEKSSSSTG